MLICTKLTILNAASYLRCITRRYTQLRGPTLLNNHGNYGGNSFVTVPKMKVSDLINIWVGGVNNINELPVGKVGKRRSLLACPHFFVLVVALGGIGQ